MSEQGSGAGPAPRRTLHTLQLFHTFLHLARKVLDSHTRSHVAADPEGNVHRPGCFGRSERGAEEDVVPEDATGAGPTLEGA